MQDPDNNKNTKPFSKGRRAADTLKLTYFVFSILAAITVFSTGLPILFLGIVAFCAYPIWNIIDGLVDQNDQLEIMKQEEWDETKFHTIFNWLMLGFVSFFTLILCVVAAIRSLSTFVAGTAVVGGIPLAVMMGPVGATAFAITMIWTFTKSLRELMNMRYHTEQFNHQAFDCSAWFFASIGATGLAIASILAVASISFPPAIPIVFTGITLISAFIIIYQMFMHHHPITPINEYEPLSNSTHNPVNSKAIGNKCSLDNTALDGNNDVAHNETSTNKRTETNLSK